MAEITDQIILEKCPPTPSQTHNFLPSEKLASTLDEGEGEGSFPESLTSLKE